jgi:hypothetical protein
VLEAVIRLPEPGEFCFERLNASFEFSGSQSVVHGIDLVA